MHKPIKFTKEELEKLILEETDNLTEEELQEIFGGLKRRYKAWSSGRKHRKRVQKWEEYKGNLGTKLEQLADMYEKSKDDIFADLAKSPDLVAFAKQFEPWKEIAGGIGGHVRALRTASQKVLSSPVEVSSDEDPEMEAASGGEVPEVAERLSPGDKVKSTTGKMGEIIQMLQNGMAQVKFERGGSVAISPDKLALAEHKNPPTNKKIRIVKKNG